MFYMNGLTLSYTNINWKMCQRGYAAKSEIWTAKRTPTRLDYSPAYFIILIIITIEKSVYFFNFFLYI